MILSVSNHGPLITASNFWREPGDALYLSLNAGAFRLLIPAVLESIIPDLATGREAVITRGNWRGHDALEILLDDESQSPWSCHLGPGSFDRFPLDTDAGKEWIFSVWTRPRRAGNRPHKALERKAYYRRADALPCLRPWGG